VNALATYDRRPGTGLGFVTAAAGGAGAIGVGSAGWAAVAVPIVGPAVAAVTMAILAKRQQNALNKRKATYVVDSLEPLLVQNRDAYLQGMRTVSAQAYAVQNFDDVWADVVQACSDPSLGDPGRRCISERQRGGQWDWFALYRDPIALDSPVADPVLTPASAVSGWVTPITDALNSSEFRPLVPYFALALVGVGLVGVFANEN